MYMSYSYLYQEKYIYYSTLFEMIEAIKVERAGRKNNKDLIATTFAEDLITALRECA